MQKLTIFIATVLPHFNTLPALICRFIKKLFTNELYEYIKSKYRKSSKETRRSYSFFEGLNAGLIKIWPGFGHFCLLFFKFFLRVLLECGSYSRAALD